MVSLASCRSFEQGNVISWAKSVKLWNTSHVELRSAAATGDDEDIMSTPFAKNSPFCATHKARLKMEHFSISCNKNNDLNPVSHYTNSFYPDNPHFISNTSTHSH